MEDDEHKTDGTDCPCEPDVVSFSKEAETETPVAEKVVVEESATE